MRMPEPLRVLTGENGGCNIAKVPPYPATIRYEQ